MRGAPSWPEITVGLAVVGLAGLVAYGVLHIPTPAYAKVGPTVAPWGVAGALAALGTLLAITGLRGGWEHDRTGEIDWKGLLWLIAGLLLNLVLIDGISFGDIIIIPRAGFIIASSIMFVCVARAFASRQPLRDTAIALVLTILAYVGFDRLLGYKIGTGLIESLI
jgi:putative tricarboxylic transport membrane protein